MGKLFDKNPGPESVELPPTEAGTREIIIPHVRDARPATAIKHVGLLMSIAQLQDSGYYERYEKLIAPNVLAQLQSGLAMAWTPVDLALAHYEACENLMLTNEQMAALGKSVGNRISETTLVAKGRAAGTDLWQEIDGVHRMWGRLTQGGSAQVVKVGPKDLLLELWGFKLTRFHYYRQAQVTFISSAFRSVGTRLTHAKLVRHSAARDEVSYRFSWE